MRHRFGFGHAGYDLIRPRATLEEQVGETIKAHPRAFWLALVGFIGVGAIGLTMAFQAEWLRHFALWWITGAF